MVVATGPFSVSGERAPASVCTASVFFVGELMTSQKTVQSATFLALESLTIVGIIYFVLNFVLSKLLVLLERRLTISD